MLYCFTENLGFGLVEYGRVADMQFPVAVGLPDIGLEAPSTWGDELLESHLIWQSPSPITTRIL